MQGFKNRVVSKQIKGTWRTEQVLNDTTYYIQNKNLHNKLGHFFILLSKLKVNGEYYRPMPLWFELGENMSITVWGGFKTDYASIPRPLWILLAPEEIKRAAILHDAGYRILWFLFNDEIISKRQFSYFRKVFDDLFLEAMGYVDPPILEIQKRGAYKAVRWFGWMKGAGLRDQKIIENNFPENDRIFNFS